MVGLERVEYGKERYGQGDKYGHAPVNSTFQFLRIKFYNYYLTNFEFRTEESIIMLP